MKLVIDAYNILKAVERKNIIGATVQERFIKQLQKYAKHKGHTIVVVFDGGHFSWPTYEDREFITVVYSGTGQTADEVIMKILDESVANGTISVSSDREIKTYAQQLGVQAVGGFSFYQKMLAAKELVKSSGMRKSRDQAIKLHTEENHEVDQLMREGSDYLVIKSEIDNSRAVRSVDKLSKKERKINQKIKKL